jgi:hypothetical protein
MDFGVAAAVADPAIAAALPTPPHAGPSRCGPSVCTVVSNPFPSVAPVRAVDYQRPASKEDPR